MYLLDTKTNAFAWWFIIIVRIAWLYAGDRSFKFLPYHAFDGSVVDYHGCDGWRRIRVRFRRGSLRNSYHIQGRQQARKLPNANTVRQRKTITIAGLSSFANRNEHNLNTLVRIQCRASLVPAAAVIPAAQVYIKVVAVKKLVVGYLS